MLPSSPARLGVPGPRRCRLRHRQLCVGFEVLQPDGPEARGSDFGPDPLNPESHWANSVENQEHVRPYVKVSVRDEHLQVENIRSGTCDAPNAAVELGQEDWCGPDEGAGAVLPVGSVVDDVIIHTYDDSKKGRSNPAATVTTQQDSLTVTTID